MFYCMFYFTCDRAFSCTLPLLSARLSSIQSENIPITPKAQHVPALSPFKRQIDWPLRQIINKTASWVVVSDGAGSGCVRAGPARGPRSPPASTPRRIVPHRRVPFTSS